MIKAIIFDCFGVLAGMGYKSIYQRAGGDLARDGVFVQDALDAANRGLITPRELHQQVADRLGVSYEDWYEAVQEGEMPNLPMLAFAAELGETYKIAMLSNADMATIRHKFSPEQLGFFDAIVVSAEVGIIKPDPAIYKLTAEKLGVEPEACVFIDDVQSYCEGARAVGMQAIQFQDFEQFKRELTLLLQ